MIKRKKNLHWESVVLKMQTKTIHSIFLSILEYLKYYQQDILNGGI
jgi:hypothetical protein